MFTRIVVGVDCREGGRDALALAALLQEVGGGELVAVHACVSEPFLREDVSSLIDRELARTGVKGRPLVVTDRSPAHALRTIAERDAAELIVIGSTRRAGVDRVVAGDDAAATLHCAPCAVAVAPRGLAESPHALRRIGVGLDESRESRYALEVARRLARRAGAALSAITVVAPTVPVWPAVAWNTAWAGDDPSIVQPDDRRLAATSAEVGDDATPETMVGTPWKQLAERSADLDLLVVGSRSYGPLRRLLLGSTSTKLTRRAACPLLVTPRRAYGTAAGTLLAAARLTAR